MKKFILLTLFSIPAVFAMAVLLTNETGSGLSVSASPGTSLPDSVRIFVQNTCMDCHADDGNFMAKGKVNFSSWDKYDSVKQINKAKEICKELTKKGMPPGKWCKNNPDNVPTQASIDMMCRWANSLQK